MEEAGGVLQDIGNIRTGKDCTDKAILFYKVQKGKK